MTVEIIPTVTDGTAFYNQVTPLDGKNYQLFFAWNNRTENWYLTLRTEAGDQIKGCEGMKIVQGGLPLARVTDTNRPPGELVVDSSSDDEPTLTNFGTDTTLGYVPKADVEELLGDE